MPAPVQVNIPAACHESWDQMIPSAAGNYCASCKKTVTDFTLMSDREILAFLANAGSNSCGRFTPEQLNRNLLQGENKKRISLPYIWNFIVTTTLLTFNTNGQSRSSTYKNPIQKVSFKSEPLSPMREIIGVVLNKETNLPVPFATVRQKGASAISITDSLGRYSISLARVTDPVVQISSVGYQTQEYTVNGDDVQPVFYMQPAGPMQEVVVKGYASRTMCSTVGGLVYVRKESIRSKVAREAKNWFEADKYISVYPNPVRGGQSLSIHLTLKNEGAYALQLIAADGRILHSQILEIQNKMETLSLPVNSAWGRGIYWLHVVGKDGHDAHQYKVIIQ